MSNLKQASDLQLMQRQRNLLAEGLSMMRQTENADIVLQCGEQEFPAHKVVLEASSPYFVLMFRSGMQESTTGRVVFPDMQPNTLDVILDFIYLGKVDKMVTQECVKEVLAAAHLFELIHLIDHCFSQLASSLSIENFLEVMNICEKYDKIEILPKILKYMANNLNDVLVTTSFLHLTCNQLKDLIFFVTLKLPSIDSLLVGIVRWLQCDLEVRSEVAQQLFQCLDAKLVSKECLKTLLEDQEVMKSSTEIANRLNELAVTLFVFTPDNFILGNDKHILPMSNKQKNMKIGFFSENNPWSTLQLFDLQIMTWMPSQKLCVRLSGVAACYHKQQIYIVGGSLGSTYVKYDVEKNALDYIGCRVSNNRTNAGVCVFQDRLFIVGGLDNGIPTTAVHYTNPGGNHWYTAKPLSFSRVSPTVLASADHIYVGGGTTTEQLIIEYSIGFDQYMFWDSITVPMVPENVDTHFLISKNTLYGYYYYNGNIVRLSYKIADGLQAKVFTVDVSRIPAVTAVYHYPDYSTSNLFVSTIEKGPPTPNFLWEPETGKWTRLPPTKGKCDIPEIDSFKKVYTRECTK